MTVDGFVEECKKYDKLFCYGAGRYGRIIRSFLAEYNIDLSGFIVSSDFEYNTRVLEVPVYSLSYLSSDNIGKYGVIIGVGKEYRREMLENLCKQNIIDYIYVEDEMFETIENSCRFSIHFQRTNNITVFCYHRVIDLPVDSWKLSVKPGLFDQQMKYLKDNYLILRAEDNWDIARGNRAAVLTFDDGYEDVYKNALPILEKYSIPATVFVCTENIDSINEFWWDRIEHLVLSSNSEYLTYTSQGQEQIIKRGVNVEETCHTIHSLLKKLDYRERNNILKKWADEVEHYLDRDYCHSLTSSQLLELSKSKLITIGGHTVTHSCLAQESIDLQKWEIFESKRIIENIINKEISVFSYPFGQKNDFSDETIEIAKDAGYKKIFAAYDGLTSDKYINGYIPRVNIGQKRDFDSSIVELGKYETLYGDDFI